MAPSLLRLDGGRRPLIYPDRRAPARKRRREKPREAQLSDNRNRSAAAGSAIPVPGEDYEKLGRDALVALLRSVIEQRDDVLSKYEAMAIQVDESTREIDDAQLDARRAAKEAATSLHHAEEEEAQVAELRRELDEERRARAALAQEFARYREAVANAPVRDPWGQLRRAISQIAGDAVAWTRSKIPPDSQFLPWFDKAIDFAEATGRLTWSWSVALYDWTRPRAIDLWKWVKSEIERRMSQPKQ